MKRKVWSGIIMGCLVGAVLLMQASVASAVYISTTNNVHQDVTLFPLATANGALITLGLFNANPVSATAKAGAVTGTPFTDPVNAPGYIFVDAASAAAYASSESFANANGVDDFNYSTNASATSYGETGHATNAYELFQYFTLSALDNVTYSFDFNTVFDGDAGVNTGAFGSSYFKFLLFGHDAAGALVQSNPFEIRFDSTIDPAINYGLGSLSLNGITDGYLYAYSEGSATAVPEPGTLLLLGAGIVGLVACRRRRTTGV